MILGYVGLAKNEYFCKLLLKKLIDYKDEDK